MRRREFIALIGGMAAVLPVVAYGQQTPRTVPLVGAIWPGKPSAPISVRLREAFLRGLRENGYIEGQNIAIEHRYAEDSDEASKAAKDIVGLRVEVITVVGTPAALAVKRATSSIPIVGLNMADPVADGLVASLSRPGYRQHLHRAGTRLQAPPIAKRAGSRDHPNRRAPASRRVQRTHNAKHANGDAGKRQGERRRVSSFCCQGAERF
jgi:hypothetical protein